MLILVASTRLGNLLNPCLSTWGWPSGLDHNSRIQEFTLDKCVFKLLQDSLLRFFLSYESLKSKKAKDFFADKLHTRVVEVRESQGSRWVCQGWSIATKKGTWESQEKKRKEKDQGRQEGGSSKGKVPCALNQEFLFFWFTSIWVWKQPVSVEVSAPALLFYEEAMCKGSSCLDADRGAREQGKADGKLKWARYFNFGSMANENQEVSFQPCFLICIGLNSIPAIELESRF